MNTKNNRLIRETDEKIIRTVYRMMTEDHRPVGKITVREICEEAEIHRSTFYAHYRDVYELVEKAEKAMSRQLTEAFFRKLDEKASARDCFTEIFAFIRDHRDFYLYYLAESGSRGVLQLAWETVRERYAGAAVGPERFGVRSEEEMEYHGAFFLTGMTTVVRMWLRNGCREEPAALYDLIRRQGTVQEAMIAW
ncbi:MAG: TetR/AcrR family transcriptional regulator C-terminal domain-containing protein [Lachnospiraceae bacterium]|nr:TetR/AcrR family transcriptional regulator C-terminal domain-containing protein [Lachnospiraceae bacterium]